ALSARRRPRAPRWLSYDWVPRIIIPLVAIARHDIELFEHKYNKDWKLNLLRIKFDIPDEHWPYVLDWSYSNLCTLYDIGYAAGEKFYRENEAALRAAALDTSAPA